jgi:hypothetical protein
MKGREERGGVKKWRVDVGFEAGGAPARTAENRGRGSISRRG